MDLKQNVINKLNLEFGKDVKCIGRSHDIYKKLQEEKSSIEKSVNYDNVRNGKKLSCSNNGFRNNKSTITACHTFIENIQNALDNNLHAVGIFLNFTKAYDVINHNILLYKLESYGVRGIINSWFKSYLSEHTQYVSITQTNGNNKNILNRYSSLPRVNLNGEPRLDFGAAFISGIY
jgi:hypothetical protein